MKKLYIVAISVMLIFISCRDTAVDAEPAEINENTVLLTEAQYKNAEITIGQIAHKEMSSILKLNGKIDVPPQNMISVSAPLGGYLTNTHLLPGMRITKGQVIATMENQQYVQLQQDYLMAKTKLQYAEQDYKRQYELNQSKASSDKITQQAQTEANSQRILMNSLEQQLRLININPALVNAENIIRRTNIYAPISGFVTTVNVNIGQYVTPTEVMFELINPSNIYLNLKVFEQDLRKLSIGQKVIAYTNDYSNKKYHCEVKRINKNITSEGTTDVHCLFLNADPTLLPGMYMNAEVQYDTKTLYALPDDAIVSFAGNQYVFENTGDKKFEMREIIIGHKDHGYTSLVNASSLLDKKIVIQGAYALLMKLKNKED